MTTIPAQGASDSDVLRFQQKRLITALFRAQLETLDDLIVEHDNAFNKLTEHLPTEYHSHVDLADYLSDAKCDQLRKRILDAGNSTIRALDEVLKSFDVRLR